MRAVPAGERRTMLHELIGQGNMAVVSLHTRQAIELRTGSWSSATAKSPAARRANFRAPLGRSASRRSAAPRRCKASRAGQPSRPSIFEWETLWRHRDETGAATPWPSAHPRRSRLAPELHWALAQAGAEGAALGSETPRLRSNWAAGSAAEYDRGTSYPHGRAPTR